MAIQFRGAKESDWESVAGLLAGYDLTTDGAQDWLDEFIVAQDGDQIIGVAGLEIYAGSALLRSVAVKERNHGLGRQMVERLIARAREHHLDSVVLLTETAENYFPRFGFERINRADAPESVWASREFQGACPDTAAVMQLRLTE